MVKNIDQEIEKLLEIKKEVDKILELQKSIPNLMVVSQARYDFFKTNNLLKSSIYYHIAPVEVRSYIEGFQG